MITTDAASRIVINGTSAGLPVSKNGRQAMPITKRPCSNCPFRNDGAGIELRPGRLEGIVSNLLADDQHSFICHKTLSAQRKMCAGAVGLMSKLNRLPVIARVGLAVGMITAEDIEASANLVINPCDLASPESTR